MQEENQRLVDTIRNQEGQLRTQKVEQRELRAVIAGLQEQVDLLQASGQAQVHNGTVNDSELMQVVLPLRYEVRILQGQ